MSKNDKNLISQTEASKIAGVSRQAINDIKKKGTYNFFAGTKVDTSSQHWQAYLSDRENSMQGKPLKKQKIEKNIVVGKKKKTEKFNKNTIESNSQKFAFYGGVDPQDGIFTPQNISDVKRLAEIQKIAFEMQEKSGNLIDRKIIEHMMDALSGVVQSYFIDLPRRYSTQICQITESVGMEREIEKILNDPIKKGITQFKKVAEKACKVVVK